MRFSALAALAVLGSLLATVHPEPARSACYDAGCTDEDYLDEDDLVSDAECDLLWEMRNQIYKDHGYCFRTERAISFFGNGGCHTRDASDLDLSEIEEANIATIQRVERIKRCPR